MSVSARSASEVRGEIAPRRYRSSDGQTLIGFSSMILGAIGIGIVLLGWARGNEIVPVLLVSGGGLLIAAAWCGVDKRYPWVAVFGAFAGFNLSYAFLQLGVSNNWYSIPYQDLSNVVTVYSIIWIAVLIMLSFFALQAAMGAIVIFAAAAASLVIVAIANAIGSLTLLKWAALPAALIIVMSATFLEKVLWGWHLRNQAEAARASGAEPAVPLASMDPMIDRRQHPSGETGS